MPTPSKSPPRGTTPPVAPFASVERFELTGLYGHTSFDIPLANNRLVLVGENGSGKSTLLNLLFYCLTAQWERMSEVAFNEVAITVDGKRYAVSHKDLVDLTERAADGGPWGFVARRLGISRTNRLRAELMRLPLRRHHEPTTLLYTIAERYGLPVEVLQDCLGQVHLRRKAPLPEPLKTLSEVLDKLSSAQILYLPTFRRIERDLTTIFPDARISSDLRNYDRNAESRSGFIELVEFGMEDVNRSFKATMQELERTFRTDLSRLTGAYLRDVIRGTHQDVQPDIFIGPDVKDNVGTVLSRIEDDILLEEDREALRELVAAIQASGAIPANRHVAAHFLAKLIKIHESQRERENRVHALTKVCNEYLGKKRMVFDPFHFEVVICRTSPEGEPIFSETVPLDGLSSGEKQIVSLFAHLYLGGAERYFVVIDEPELSISVPWQKRFLEDISNSEVCVGLVAVTHSPFIFANSLQRYANSIEQFSVG